MKTFELFREEDPPGVSGKGVVAEGVQFGDGSCVLRWTTAVPSTGVYANIEDVEKIHGHNGKTALVWTSDVFNRARTDCIQDGAENAPFASIGGLARRQAMVAPHYISQGDEAEYLRGYRYAARQHYGESWDICSFGWAPAMTIGGEP